jgi:hypothetical protein
MIAHVKDRARDKGIRFALLLFAAAIALPVSAPKLLSQG